MNKKYILILLICAMPLSQLFSMDIKSITIPFNRLKDKWTFYLFKKNNSETERSLVLVKNSKTFNENKTGKKRKKSINDPNKNKNVHYFFSQLHKAEDAKKLYRKWMFEYHPDAGVYEDKQYAQEQTVKINKAKKAFDEGKSLHEEESSCSHRYENFYSDGCGHYRGWWGHCTFSVGKDHLQIHELHLRLSRIWLAYIAGSFLWEFVIRDHVHFYDKQQIGDSYIKREWKIRDEE